MQSIEIVTASDNNYADFILLNKFKLKKFNYKMCIYDLGGLGFGLPINIDKSDFIKKERDIYIKCYFKLLVLRESLKQTKSDLIVWMDADAFILKPIDNLLNDDFDVAITKRWESEIIKFKDRNLFEYSKYINAGVIFFKNNTKARKFIDLWDQKIIDSDQRALNDLLEENVSKFNYGDTFTLDDIKVKVLSCKEYNNYKYKEIEAGDNIKIIHFKGMTKPNRYKLEKYIMRLS